MKANNFFSKAAVGVLPILCFQAIACMISLHAMPAIAGNNVWTPINKGLYSGTVDSIAIHPTNTNTVYAGTFYGGVFKTTDGGNSWTAVNTGLANTQIQSLAISPSSPNTVYAGTSDYGGGGGIVFRTTNGGENWTAINNGLTEIYVQSMAINPSSPNTIYAGTYGSGVFIYTDSASSSGTLGDLNGVGGVDLADAIIALRILADIDVGNVPTTADVNGDSRIGLEEVIYILQKISGLR